MPPPSTGKSNVVSIARPKPGAVATFGHEDIARRAYERYEARGRTDGSALEDWVLAEQELASVLATAVAKPRRRAVRTTKTSR
jgi:hypothetical protein